LKGDTLFNINPDDLSITKQISLEEPGTTPKTPPTERGK
jgi:hypothetical protein